jgi:hypothetical protein
MTLTLALLLQLLALGCFVAATFGVTARVNLVAAGLALFMVSVLLV